VWGTHQEKFERLFYAQSKILVSSYA